MAELNAPESKMTNEQFSTFVSRHFASDAKAAPALGIGRMSIGRIRAGIDRGKPVPVPLWLALTCAAYEAGIRDWDGGPLQITSPITIQPEAA